MAADEKLIQVYENWSSETPKWLGTLYVGHIRGQEIFSFAYSDEWIKATQAGFMLDPDLALYSGRQYTPLDKKQFGLFADSSPDRWGRLLMQRKEAIRARKADEKPRSLTESDYLLGVYDEARMGALRFSLDGGKTFVSSDEVLATPPWVSLRKLEAASRAFEQGNDDLEEQWLDQLLAPGSSLGGARPKATVQAPDRSLWIAKFPAKNDTHNTGAWEKVVHDLAGECGLDVPESKLERFSPSGSTFLVKRFDREGTRRVHFASAMTLLGQVDGSSAQDGSSYLDLVDFIRANGAQVDTDLTELWKRIVFNMVVSNTDDHLRNHGFLLTDSGWKLSPLYDVNPVPYGNALSLNVSDADNSIDLDLAIEVSHFFGIPKEKARSIAKEICSVVAGHWQQKAGFYGLSRNEMERMKPAFSVCNKVS